MSPQSNDFGDMKDFFQEHLFVIIYSLFIIYKYNKLLATTKQNYWRCLKVNSFRFPADMTPLSEGYSKSF